MRRPNLIARNAGDPCVDNRMEYFEIDRLGDVMSVPRRRARSSLSPSVSAVRNTKGICPRWGASAFGRSSTSKPDMMGMLISHNSRSGMTLRIATKPSYPSCANDHIEAAIGKLLSDQSRNFAVVIGAKNFLASFGHPFAPTRNKGIH